MRLVLLRDLHFICIFIDAIKLELLIDISKLHCEDLSSHQTITLLLQSERLNQLRLTLLANIVYIACLSNPTPNHHLPSIRFPKMYKKLGMLQFFYKRLGEEEQKAFSVLILEMISLSIPI